MGIKPLRAFSIVIGASGVLFIVASAYLIHSRERRDHTFSLSVLPKKALDYRGRAFERDNARMKVSVIQYGGAPLPHLFDVWRDYESQMIYVHLTEGPPDPVMAQSQSAFILPARSVKSFEFFYGKYFVLDYSGKMVSWGYNKDNLDGISLALASIFRNFDPRELIPNLANIGGTFQRCDGTGYTVLALFRSFCSSCRNGSLIQKLKRISSRNTSGIAIAAVLDANVYSEEDKNALVSQAAVPFPVVLSQAALTAKWHSLSYMYGSATLDGVLFLFERGEILDYADASCGCDDQFFQKVEDIVADKEKDK
jgi:hypothetical protein